MIAVTLGAICYALLLWMLGTTALRVMGPLPDWIMERIRHLWGELNMLYFTVRYEDDDAGTWQIIEDRDGNRYRIHIRDDKGDMKW